MSNMMIHEHPIPGFKLSFSQEERDDILTRIDTVLESGILSQGPNVHELERRVAEMVNVRHALAVNSGSSAIELPLRALRLEGKDVLVPTNTFLATAMGVILAGGRPVLVDIEPTTLSPGLAQLQSRVTAQTAGVILVHIGGIISPEIEIIRRWCQQQGYWLFEDAAHAYGSTLNWQAAGTFGVAGGYSFFATKVMTCGEGGMVVTNNTDIADFVRLYRNHGKPEPWVSYHDQPGSNCRMSELHAALAIVQLDYFKRKQARREEIAAHYTALLQTAAPWLTPVLPHDHSSWYKYIALLPGELDRQTLKQSLKEKGISLSGEVYDRPLHQQPAMTEYLDGTAFPAADLFCLRHICLPLYPELTDEQVERIAYAIGVAGDETWKVNKCR